MLTALVVGDSPASRRRVATLLQLAGWEVFESSGAGPARRAAAQLRPDLVVTDLRMRGGHGAALVQQLRAEGCTARLLVTTARPSERLRAQLAAQHVGCLAKPVDPRAFVRFLRFDLRPLPADDARPVPCDPRPFRSGASRSGASRSGVSRSGASGLGVDFRPFRADAGPSGAEVPATRSTAAVQQVRDVPPAVPVAPWPSATGGAAPGDQGAEPYDAALPHRVSVIVEGMQAGDVAGVAAAALDLATASLQAGHPAIAHLCHGIAADAYRGTISHTRLIQLLVVTSPAESWT